MEYEKRPRLDNMLKKDMAKVGLATITVTTTILYLKSTETIDTLSEYFRAHYKNWLGTAPSATIVDLQ